MIDYAFVLLSLCYYHIKLVLNLLIDLQPVELVVKYCLQSR